MQTQEGAAMRAQREGVVDSSGGTGETLETLEPVSNLEEKVEGISSTEKCTKA